MFYDHVECISMSHSLDSGYGYGYGHCCDKSLCVSNDIIFDSIERENRIHLAFEHGADRVRHAE